MSVSSNPKRRLQSYQYPPSHTSSRSTYPSFLSIQISLRLQLTWAWRGLYDAFRWNVVISAVVDDAEIRANIYKSLLLNSLSLVSIYIFDLLLLPLVQGQQKWFHRNIGWFYQALWLFPVVGTSFYFNSTWCSTIAKRTYTLQHGSQAGTQQSVTYTGMLTAIATSAYRVVMVFTSVILSFALRSIPYIGPLAGFIFLCWLDAYYCFEFVWIARGMSLSRRVRHLEERWAYYFAFGLPSAALCTFATGLANVAIFALVFPMFIILATHGRPVPLDPYNPLPQDNSDTPQHPSPFVPIRIPVFGIIMWLNDLIVRILSVGGGPSKRSSTSRNRAISDDARENVEDGDTTKLVKANYGPNVPVRPTRGRINIGRRKED
ncbi:etoposide-induced protein 2.4-domain-containing protein [Collybia nuda]|uniref:Etoposide-induced protein 2.4-domain-containing protein n=1 Tax=Collybia nuda TaxID=64659 RepID=A0A9P5YCU7_9AGAR|nr:etoposide-induced protein 2.4-domain-containing protein [Collybia nuda]